MMFIKVDLTLFVGTVALATPLAAPGGPVLGKRRTS